MSSAQGKKKFQFPSQKWRKEKRKGWGGWGTGEGRFRFGRMETEEKEEKIRDYQSGIARKMKVAILKGEPRTRTKRKEKWKSRDLRKARGDKQINEEEQVRLKALITTEKRNFRSSCSQTKRNCYLSYCKLQLAQYKTDIAAKKRISMYQLSLFVFLPIF